MSDLPLSQTSTFPFPLFNSLSHFYSKNKFSLSWVFLYLTSSSTSISLSPLELSDLFIFSINYLTFSSTYLSPSHLLNSLTSSSLQLIAPPISYLNLVLGFFFLSLPVIPMVLLLFKSQRCIISPFVSLFIFCYCIHLRALSCMSLWIKLYRAIVMFVVQFE